MTSQRPEEVRAPVVVLVRWESILGELFERTGKFPRSVRFSLTSRIDNLALDVLEGLIEARYGHKRAANLHAANLALEKLRALLRLAHRQRHLGHKGHEHLARHLDEAGRMIGGWQRSLGAATR